ncbi:aspartic peptidase domain-containing protein [Endogone sp. FLAS-F59071]|nr:aspartic peptidase domain-containing protein [Endogone sp. FLAS-F59071]|eukprot:RUS15556.1 aspartic peptidase domain-containing protein [Endogone sp. FLAS-F59071]
MATLPPSRLVPPQDTFFDRVAVAALPPSAQQNRVLIAHLDVYGNVACDFFVRMNVGGVMQNLIIDTGSSTTAVVSTGCTTGCSSVKPPHYPLLVNASTTTAVSTRYGTVPHDVSWDGVWTQDTIFVPDPGATNISTTAWFASITNSTNFFLPLCPQNQGIWGLAYSLFLATSTRSPGPTLFEAFVARGMPNGFTVQLCPRRESAEVNGSDAQEERAGHLWLGGYASTFVGGGGFRFVPIVKKDYFEVHLEAVMVGEVVVAGMEGLSRSKTIVDTGTSPILLSRMNLQALLTALSNSRLLTLSPDIPSSVVTSFWLDNTVLHIPRPNLTISRDVTLSLIISGEIVTVPTENFLRIVPAPHLNNTDIIEVSWTGFADGGSDNEVVTVLGNTLLQGKTVFFERGSAGARSRDADFGRIGFADAVNCFERSYAADVDVLAGSSWVGAAASGDDGGTEWWMVWFIVVLGLLVIASWRARNRLSGIASQLFPNWQKQLQQRS